jgi:hypothetical protein
VYLQGLFQKGDFMSAYMFKFVALLFLFQSPQVMADEVINPTRFIYETGQISVLCDKDFRCPAPYNLKNIFRHSEQQPIDMDLKKALTRIAKSQAQVWADTILEGDYVAEGYTRLDRVEEMYKHNILIGYLIKYSEKAWDTSDCSYDGIRDSTLVGCVGGRIVESSYVSVDLKHYFYDVKTGAQFR